MLNTLTPKQVHSLLVFSHLGVAYEKGVQILAYSLLQIFPYVYWQTVTAVVQLENFEYLFIRSPHFCLHYTTVFSCVPVIARQCLVVYL